MVLSNAKLKRKKREEAAAVAALNPPPESTATPSLVNAVERDSAVVLSTKKKKRPKSKAVNGDAKDGTVGSVPEEMRDTRSIPEVTLEGNVLGDVPVQKSKKKRKTASVATPMEVEDVGNALPSLIDAGVSGENGLDGTVPGADPGHEGAPKTKIRKKPRWELDENGQRVKPQNVEGDSKGPSNGAVDSLLPGKGAEVRDVVNDSVEKDGDAAVVAPDAVNNGDRIHQGDEPWLQSKRSKKKKKLTDRWGKKLNDAEAVSDDHAANQEAPQVTASTEKKLDPKKVVVGGMPYYISEDDIHEYFQECGTIAELDCMTFPDTGKFKGIAFITFRTEEAAKRALALDGADMGGRFLKIEICEVRPKEPAKKEAYKEPPKKYDGCLSAYIGNLSWDITEKELRKFFKGCKIDSIRFAMNNETGEFRGFGHVDFADDESLEAAMKLDQMPVLDRPLKIAYSVPPKNRPVEAKHGQLGARQKGCFNCGEEGHMSYNCPKKL